MKFTKMNGLGNDYIYVDVDREKISDPERAAKELSDRHFSIGGDGLVLMQRSSVADAKMSIYNADGTEAEMCGNALRCVAKYAYEHGWALDEEFFIETKAGVKRVRVYLDGRKVVSVKADIGRAKKGFDGYPFYREILLDADRYAGYCVDVGNPHYVIFSESFPEDLASIGERIGKRNGCFLSGANVEFVKKEEDKSAFFVRVVERGSGETYACGTGAAAVFFCARELGYVNDEARIRLRGGEILCKWEDNGISITGDTRENFVGEIRTE